MSKALQGALFALLLGACATTDAKKSKEPVREKMTVSNNSPFDVAVCGTRELLLTPPTEEVVQGALLTLSPGFQECFLDPLSLEAAPTDVKVKVTLTEGGTQTTVSGAGVTEAGKACLSAAVAKLRFSPLAAGEKAISGEVPVMLGVKPVAYGINVASDVSGKLRLALPSMCSCFAALKDSAPPQPVAKLKLTTTAPPEVTITDAAEAPELATCLSSSIQALTFPTADMELPFAFLLINSYATDTSPTASAPLRFQQLEAIRAQRTADVLMAAGRRGKAATLYDEVVKKYKAKPAGPLIKELRSKCADVVGGDDANLAALKGLLDTYQAEMKLAQAEKAAEPAWAKVEEGLTVQIAQASAELTRVTDQKASDQKACPKDRP